MTVNGYIRITDTLQYIPNRFLFPTTTTEYYLLQSVGYILSLLQYPSTTLPFISYGDSEKNSINQISRLLHIRTWQPRLPTLTLPLLIPPTPSNNPSLAPSNVPLHSPSQSVPPPAPSPRMPETAPVPRVPLTTSPYPRVYLQSTHSRYPDIIQPTKATTILPIKIPIRVIH